MTRKGRAIAPAQSAKVTITPLDHYREDYANSVQVRVNLWDFFLQFGRLNQKTANDVEIQAFQGIYLSPQQAKALQTVLTQNIAQYESAFGEIKLDPSAVQSGAVQ